MEDKYVFAVVCINTSTGTETEYGEFQLKREGLGCISRAHMFAAKIAYFREPPDDASYRWEIRQKNSVSQPVYIVRDRQGSPANPFLNR